MLDQLLRAEKARLARQARFHSRCAQDAEEALADACVQFLRFYEGGSGNDALRWMMVVIKRCAWALSRRSVARDGHRAPLADAELSPLGQGSAEVAELVERTEDTARVIALIEQLKPDERTALILLGLGCSYAEIGELRGWTLSKVHRCISEGRARVRDLLRREGAN
jgi:DNA-directed RNA polymerase specialized sigma24 family protein